MLYFYAYDHMLVNKMENELMLLQNPSCIPCHRNLELFLDTKISFSDGIARYLP